MSDTTINPIENNTATTVTADSPSVLAPQISEKDLFAMPMEDLKKAAFEPAQPAPIAQPQPQTSQEPYTVQQGPDGITIQMSPESGGEVFKGRDFNEVIAKLAKSKADGNAYIKQLKSQPGTQSNEMPQQFPDPAMQQSPEEAQREAAQFLQSLVLTPEVKRQIVSEALSSDPRVHRITSTVQEFQNNNLTFEFHRRVPEYQDTPEHSAALLESLASIAGVDPQRLGENGYQPNVDDLEAAYALAVYRKKITPYVQPTQPVQISRPPVMPSAGAQQFGGDQSVWEMPLDELKRRAGI